MSFSGDIAEQARSMAFFTDPSNYGPFYLNSRDQRAYGCIDPRDEDRDKLHIIMQTPGGAAGLGFDQSMAYSTLTGEPVNLEAGVEQDSLLRRVTVATGHRICAFLLGESNVNKEIASPSEMTKDTLGDLAARYRLDDRPTYRRDLRRVRDTALRNQDMFDRMNPDALLEAVDSCYPDHENVGSMLGDNAAGIYIFNHHPYVGLDRAKVHRGENPLQVQAYHTSIRASLEGLLGLTMPGELKNLRLAAFILREAATPTVLIGKDPRINILHVVPGPRGLQFEQQYRRAA